MLILAQSKKMIVNLDFTARIYNAGHDIMFSDMKGRDYFLGSYATDERAMQVIEEIANKNAMYIKCDGGPMATVDAFIQPFAYTPPKTYKLPAE